MSNRKILRVRDAQFGWCWFYSWGGCCNWSCLFVCVHTHTHTNSRIYYCKVIGRFHWNLMLWLRLPIGINKSINFWWWSGPGYGFRVTFPAWYCSMGVLGNLLEFLVRLYLPAAFHETEMTDIDENESTTFWEWSSRSGSIRKSGLEYQITFGWGHQSSMCTWRMHSRNDLNSQVFMLCLINIWWTVNNSRPMFSLVCIRNIVCLYVCSQVELLHLSSTPGYVLSLYIHWHYCCPSKIVLYM